MRIIQNFFRDEEGAVTVDWVVLTAAVCGISIGIVAELRGNSNGLADLTQNYLEQQDPAAAAGGNIQDANGGGGTGGQQDEGEEQVVEVN